MSRPCAPFLPALDKAQTRAPAVVMQDHVLRWCSRDIEGTLAGNYDRDVLAVTPERCYLGLSGCRALEREFDLRFPGGGVHVERLEVGETIAVLSWRVAGQEPGTASHGVDAFYIRHGRIFLQTRELFAA